MCGIAGQLNFARAKNVDPDTIRKMCLAIRHRGPDGTGIYVDGPIGLGSTRLSIIDLAGGRMPLSNEDGSIWITFNGEVYNFQRLRTYLEALGHRFRTHTDTETIVHLYEEADDDFPNSLEGMFAFALWDSNRQKLILVRDHVGIKPLYYAVLDDRIVFASEIKSLFAAGIDPIIDRVALHDYLSLNYVPGPRTMIANVRRLQPGHVLSVNARTRHIEDRRFWDYPRKPSHDVLPLKAAEEELHGLLREVVRDTMISDVPIGAFLSGGIDSSLVVALMSETAAKRFKTFSIGFDEYSYNELPFARIVSDQFGTDHHELLLRPNATDLVRSMAEYFDEPFADNSALAVYAVSQLASSHVKVVLSGDGGDEVFGGYYTYLADRWARFYRLLPNKIGAGLIPWFAEQFPPSFEKASFDFKLKRFVQAASLPPLQAHLSWKAYLSEEAKHELYAENHKNGVLRPTTQLLNDYFDETGATDLVNDMLYLDTKVQLPDCMLTKVDRMSMAHSLEVRVPMLDQRIIEFMAKLPGDYKVRKLQLKFLLKRVAMRILPASIINRPKAGFTIPIAHWLRSELRDMMMDTLSREKIAAHGLFDHSRIAKMVDSHVTGVQDCSRPLWTLMMFHLWYDRYVLRRSQGGASPDSESLLRPIERVEAGSSFNQ